MVMLRGCGDAGDAGGGDAADRAAGLRATTTIQALHFAPGVVQGGMTHGLLLKHTSLMLGTAQLAGRLVPASWVLHSTLVCSAKAPLLRAAHSPPLHCPPAGAARELHACENPAPPWDALHRPHCCAQPSHPLPLHSLPAADGARGLHAHGKTCSNSRCATGLTAARTLKPAPTIPAAQLVSCIPLPPCLFGLLIGLPIRAARPQACWWSKGAACALKPRSTLGSFAQAPLLRAALPSTATALLARRRAGGARELHAR